MEDVHETHVNGVKRYRFGQLFITAMTQHPELLCIIILGFLSLITKYGNSTTQEKTVTASAKRPHRFFPIHSNLVELPFGDVDVIADLIEDEEVLFVMYYSPWCAASMEARWEFFRAAKFLQDQVKFVAINCWWPEGECRQRYKFMEYPVLFFYHTFMDGFRYTGVIKADHLSRFVEDMLYPLDLLHSQEEVKNLVARHDTAVIGYFDFNVSPQPPGFKHFYHASMLIIEQDNRQPPKFAVITRKSIGSSLQIDGEQSLLLVRLGNSSLMFTSQMNYTSTNIVRWIMTNRHQPAVKWISPPGKKSLMLHSEIVKGPALLVFTTYTPLYDFNFLFDMTREVAYSYNNCQSHEFIKEIIRKSYSARIQSFNELKRNQILCSNNQQVNDTLIVLPNNKCCKSILSSQSSNGPGPTVCEYCLQKMTPDDLKWKLCDIELKSSFGDVPMSGDIPVHMCLDSFQYYNVNDHRTLCCKQCHLRTPPDNFIDSYFRTVGRTTTDPFVLRSGEKLPKKLCSRHSLLKQSGPVLRELPTYVSDVVVPSNFTGLKCRTNKTLNFYAMDSRQHQIFLDKLGASKSTSSAEPTVVIVDKKNEAQYFLREKFNTENLAKFIINYTQGDLHRYLRSSFNWPADCNSTDVCIVEVTSSTWDKVMDSDKDVMLLFYAPWCGFCAAFAHIYISLARYFKTSRNLLFARIDADNNDLPWEFTVEQYPSLIFFPAHRRAESVMFLSTIPKELPNLIRFVLTNVQSELRSHHAMSSCSQNCVQTNIQKARIAVSILHHKIEKLNRRYNRLLLLMEKNNLRIPEENKLQSQLNSLKRSISKNRNKLGKTSLLYRHLSSGDEKIFEKFELQKLLHGLGQDKHDQLGPNPFQLLHDEL